ncbi:MAG: response regulator [Ruminococcus sp.]|nr:response regulator [Ruminococcus sp.]
MNGKNKHTIAIIIIAAVLLIGAAVAEIVLVFRLTSAQNRQSGSDRLEVICGELEETINEEKQSTMRFAMQLQPLLGDKTKCEDFIRRKKAEMKKLTGEVCFNAYAASEDWSYIPDFDMPDDYEAQKRSWYQGAKHLAGEPYVTDPYIDAMTGNVCFTVSVLLEEQQTVVAMDYTMEDVQKHIKQLYKEGQQTSVIVTEEGIIAGCNDDKLIGKNLIQNLPDYGGIFSLVKNADTTVSIKQRNDNLFAVRSGFGWYLIICENNRSLYRTSYIQILVMLIISLVIFGIVLTLYLITARSARRAEVALSDNRSFMADISASLRQPLQRIYSLADSDDSFPNEDYERNLAGIREYSVELSQKIEQIRTYSDMVNKKGSRAAEKKRKRPLEITVSRHFRSIILTMLLIVMAVSLYISITSAASYGRGQMQKAAARYEYQLSEWINTQKSILDMFSSTISTNPEMLDDYEGTVEYLDRITKQYPEISVSYMTNPDLPHTVYMNNGWEPDENWHVEERDWYKDLMNSESDWIISSPYYDEQTGLYCVTFAEKVYDHSTGKFLGNFGIDFYMDKLVDILGDSYTDSGYAFLADAGGEIINHPYGKYQMTVNSSVNVISLPYSSAEPDGEDVSFIKDHDGRIKVLIADRNEDSGFSIYVVNGVWAIYNRVFIYGSICVLVLLICVVVVYKVMTSLIQLQEQANTKLRESAEAAIAADEAKSSFLAQMSHEIRTPINAVLGMNEMILHESRDPDINEYAASIQSSGRMLLSLINSILDFSKIEDGKMQILPVAYDTAEMISDIAGSISHRADDKGLELIVEADEKLPKTLKGDDVRISQVISNLLTNAVKYTNEGFVKLTVREQSREGDKIELYVEVTDSGIGIKEEDMAGLFESFKRLEEKRNRNIEGTGLGMSIVTRLLDMMGSSLDVKSVYGEGSSFSFVISQTIIDPAPMGDHGRTTAQDGGTSQKLHLYAPDTAVLTVDDNSMNLKVAAALLRLFGIKTDTAGSGEEALGLLEKKHYDIVFLDHMMPKMDGIETLAEIRKRELAADDTVIIALTANAIVGAKEKYLEAGFDGYLTKPIETAALERLLEKHLANDKKQYISDEQGESEEPADEAGDTFTYREIARIRELCPQLNVSAGMGYCMDSKEFWLDTLDGFVQADKSGELDAAFEQGDIKVYGITAHSIKSAAKTIGAELLSEKARLLEFAAKEDRREYIKAEHEGFAAQYRELMENIGKVLEKCRK